ncbi:ydjO [Escherichia coli]|nr:ydjO [Escherichia coli]
MMSLWDALRMNMMISYQELVRTFLNSTCLLTLEIIDELKCVTRNLYSSDTIAPNYLHIIFNYEFLTIYYILFNHIGIFIIISGIRNNIFSLRSFIANPCQSP